MNKSHVQLLFTILVLLIFSYAAIEATSFKPKARYFPFYISLMGIVICLIEIIKQTLRLKKASDTEAIHPNIRGVYMYTALLVLYAVIVYIIGFVPASGIYLFFFLYFIAKMRMPWVIVSVVVTVAAIINFGNVMNLFWPKSLITLF